MHKAIEPGAEWVLIRADPETQTAVLRALLRLTREAAGNAQISLLLGSVPPADGAHDATLALEAERLRLAQLIAEPEVAEIGVEVLDLAVEEAEMVEVPDGGEAAGEYLVPIALLECDALINVGHYRGSATSVLANLEGLARNDRAAADGRLVDLALLADVDFALLDLLDAGEARPAGRLSVVLGACPCIARSRPESHRLICCDSHGVEFETFHSAKTHQPRLRGGRIPAPRFNSPPFRGSIRSAST